MDFAVQESTGRQYDGARAEAQTHLRHGADDPVALDDQVFDCLLEQPQVRLVFQARADRCLVQDAVGLRAGGTYGRPLR